VTEILVRDNQQVRRGDVIFRIDRARFALALQQTDAVVAGRKASLDQATSDLKRYRGLTTDAVSQQKQEQVLAAQLQAKAAYDSSVAFYRETVLSSFQQVEDNLAALRVLEQEAGVQETAVQAAQRSLDLSNTRYEGGVTSYLEVITAQNAALTDEVTAVNILGRRMASAVLLIQALGGGWDRSSLPPRPECCGKLARNTN